MTTQKLYIRLHLVKDVRRLAKLNAMVEKIAHASIKFWDALFYLLDEEKETPLRNGEVIDTLIDFEEGYYLQLTEKTVRIVKDGLTCKYIKRFSKDDFAYTKLFDWYMKETVLKEKWNDA